MKEMSVYIKEIREREECVYQREECVYQKDKGKRRM